MISFLTGTIHFKHQDSITLLVGGVGYKVFIPPSTLHGMTLSERQELFIHTQVREDALDLYGMKTPEELVMFKLLLGVSGIGAKTALLVIDRGVSQVKLALMQADVDFFTAIPRLGRKNAQKIIIDLKNKLGSNIELDLSDQDSQISEVLGGLLSMGYSKQEALQALQKIPQTEGTVEDKLRLAIQALGKGA